MKKYFNKKMVRGRRVRALVACTRNDDCCSPNPKRKDQKILNEKLSQVLSPAHTITEFFQAVTVDLDDAKHLIKNVNVESDIKPARISRRKNNSPTKLVFDGNNTFTNQQLIDVSRQVMTNVPTTPVLVNKTKSIKNGRSPPTPHRIQLCSDNAEVGKVEKEPLPLTNDLPASKPRRRLNNNNRLGNQDMKTIETDNHKLTEYFQVRRSVRKTEKTVRQEKKLSLEKALRNGIEEGLEVRVFEGKGRGVVASREFFRGDFVVEYKGDLIDPVEAKIREEKYAEDQNAGCYMYYFKHNDQQYCIDATMESGYLGRLVNHSRNGNLATRTIVVDEKPRLVLIAKDNIKAGEEVLYDYGDRSKESLKHHPWLAY